MALSEVKKALKLIGVVALVISVLLLVSSYVLAMVLGPALFFFTPEGSAFSTLHYMQELPLELFIVIFLPSPLSLTQDWPFCFSGAFLFSVLLPHGNSEKSCVRLLKDVFHVLPVLFSITGCSPCLS